MPPEPSGVETYARAAAAAAGLVIADAWWPDVVAHLDIMLTRAASVEETDSVLPEDGAAVFRP